MSDNILEFFNGFSLQTILTLGVMMWYFGRHIEQKIEKIDIDLKQQGARTDRLYEMFCEENQRQADRAEKFHSMFIDLLKEGRK